MPVRALLRGQVPEFPRAARVVDGDGVDRLDAELVAALFRAEDRDADGADARAEHVELLRAEVARVGEREIGKGDEDVGPLVRGRVGCRRREPQAVLEEVGADCACVPGSAQVGRGGEARRTGPVGLDVDKVAHAVARAAHAEAEKIVEGRVPGLRAKERRALLRVGDRVRSEDGSEVGRGAATRKGGEER